MVDFLDFASKNAFFIAYVAKKQYLCGRKGQSQKLKTKKYTIMMKKQSILIFLLLLIAAGMSAEPVIRVVSNNGSDREFATANVRKLVLSAEAVNIVDNEGSVLLTVPFAEIARVEFGEGAPTAVSATLVKDDDAVKIIENGQVYILRGGKKYTIMGMEVGGSTK